MTFQTQQVEAGHAGQGPKDLPQGFLVETFALRGGDKVQLGLNDYFTLKIIVIL
jgi:hypothetical protein